MYLLPALYPLTMNVYGSPSSDQPHLRQSFYPPHRGQEQEGAPMTRTKRAGAGAPHSPQRPQPLKLVTAAPGMKLCLKGEHGSTL